MEGLTVAKSLLTAYLHPSRTDDVQQGVLQLLNSLLLRYNEEFDGVVLAYLDIKICNWTAKILSGQFPYLSLKLKAKLLLFSPKPGMLLEGEVNKVEKDYIGVIVLGIFNAAIAFSDIREDFSYQDNHHGIPLWVSTSDDEVIRLGSKIKFSVKSVQEQSFLDICGSLMPPNTGPLGESSPFLEVERKRHTNGKREENMDVQVIDGGRVSKEFPVYYTHEKEHNKKSKSERNHTDTEAEDEIMVSKEFPVDYTNEKEHKKKSRSERNYRDAEAKDEGTVGKEFHVDYTHEKEHKKKSKSERNNRDTEAKVEGRLGKEFPLDCTHEKEHKKKSKSERNNTDAEARDEGTVDKKFPLDYTHEKEHKKKSKSERNDTDAEAKYEGTVCKKFTANQFHGGEYNKIKKRKQNDRDVEVKDGGIVRNDFPVDHVQEREHKRKIKRKGDDIDADI